MNRRTFITAVGAAAAGGSALIGTGAFTSVSASRTVTVETADDNEAFLALEELGEGEGIASGRSVKDGDVLAFSFPGTGERLDDPDLGLGVDSVYEFTQDSAEANESLSEEGLARITNQGTQPVAVYSQFSTDSALEIELFDVTSSDRTAFRDAPPELAVGEHVDVGFRIRTFDAEINEFDETLTIVAERVGGNQD
jgi:hypothetical protein